MNKPNTDSLKKATDLYSFQNSDEEVLFNKLTHELRCSVCQNQNLSDSNAPLAVDLRNELYQRVRANQDEKEIMEFVSSRYGEFVLYRPPVQWNTAFLWFGPFIVLIFGAFTIYRLIKRP